MSAQVSKEMVAGVAADSVDSSIAGAARSKWEGISPTAQLLGLVIAVWGTLIVVMIWMSGIHTSLLTEISDLISDMTAQIDVVDDRLKDVEFRLSEKILALDAKLNAIGDMTVIAFSDGTISSGELSAIWDRAHTELSGDQSPSD